ncbi:YdiY family protein [Ningiella sp. W23]|uniref:DUF481 domain-containing protein n=1 Tax=Ningiella sp. W23 TaxID=3023715 RepID=UPI003756C4C4
MNTNTLTLFIALGLASTSVIAQEEEPKPFTLDGEFGFIATTGNTDTTSISFGLNATQELERWSNVYLVEGLYSEDTTRNEAGEDVTNTTAQRVFGSAQANYKLENPNHRLFGFASYEDNRLSNFEYQATIAAGWNQLLWENDTSSFDYSIGPGYTFSEDINGESLDGFVVRAAADYNWNISETSQFTQTFSTEIGDENTRTRSETALTAQLFGGLALRVSLLLNHNTEASEDRDKLDTETAVTLVYSFF